MRENYAILIATITRYQSFSKVKEYLEELSALAATLGMKSIHEFTQRLSKPYTSTYLGKGKLKEIGDFVQANGIAQVIFDDELTPSQLFHLEKILPCAILDRTFLILKIFTMRAKTAEAKTQVALAYAQYTLPRLTGMWKHLSRQKGGVGMRGGPGEQELETDRRIIKNKIATLSKKLLFIKKRTEIHGKNRARFIRVCLVGYTNVGKSTLMRQLSKAEVYTENKLFATLDAKVRKVVLKNIPFLLTDTVGFIRKLPPDLISCFKSTLHEACQADLLLHVVDISHTSFEDHIQTVKETLLNIGITQVPTIYVFNKIDRLNSNTLNNDAEEVKLNFSKDLAKLEKSYIHKNNAPAAFISASKKYNMENLYKLLYRNLIVLKKNLFKLT